jgi:hypothetical protein
MCTSAEGFYHFGQKHAVSTTQPRKAVKHA